MRKLLGIIIQKLRTCRTFAQILLNIGTTLRELYDLAGGVAGGKELQTILMGGAAGGFLRPDELDLPLTFEAVREAKTTLGSGVVLVLDETVDMPRLLMRLAAFFRNRKASGQRRIRRLPAAAREHQR